MESHSLIEKVKGNEVKFGELFQLHHVQSQKYLSFSRKDSKVVGLTRH